MDEEYGKDVEVKNGITLSLVFAVSVIVLSPLQYGYAVGVVNAPEKILTRWFNDTYTERNGKTLNPQQIATLWGVTVSIFCIAGMLGGLSGGTLIQKLGRKGCLLTTNVLLFVAAVLMGTSKLAKCYEMIIIGRFLVGYYCGVASVAVPTYLTEIAPKQLRGAIGSFNQIGICISFLIVQILGFPQVMGTVRDWPILFSLNVTPAILQTLLFVFVPESPRYLYTTSNYEKARNALVRLRGNSRAVTHELNEMKEELLTASKTPATQWGDMFRIKVYRRALAIASQTHAAQQLSGINAVFFFSTGIFLQAGLEAKNAVYATIAFAVINLLATLLSAALIERTGRRVLFLLGLGGMWLCSILITVTLELSARYSVSIWSYLTIVLTITFVVFCAIGPNVIPWFLSTELFPPGPRPKAMSIAVIFHWLSAFVVGLLFPICFVWLNNYVFLLFTAFLSIFFAINYKYLPETKGKNPQQMLEYFLAENEKDDSQIMEKVFGNKNSQEMDSLQ